MFICCMILLAARGVNENFADPTKFSIFSKVYLPGN